MKPSLWKQIATRFLIAVDPFFSIKMHINELVINEIAKAVYSDTPLSESQNKTSILMLHSGIHNKINDLAISVIEEIKKQKRVNEEMNKHKQPIYETM